MNAEMAAQDAEGLRALLDWYRHIGVEAIIDELPHDRFAEFAQPAQPKATAPAISAPRTAAPARPAPPPAALAASR
jgi:hypothetical protein